MNGKNIGWSVKEHIGVSVINPRILKFDLQSFKSICDEGKDLLKLKFANNDGFIEVIFDDFFTKKLKTIFPWKEEYDSMNHGHLASIIYDKAVKQLLLE